MPKEFMSQMRKMQGWPALLVSFVPSLCSRFGSSYFLQQGAVPCSLTSMWVKAVVLTVWLWSHLPSATAETYTTLWLGDQFTWHTEEPPLFNVTTYSGQLFQESYPPWCQLAVNGGKGKKLARFCDLCNAFQEQFWDEWEDGDFYSYYFLAPAYVLWVIAFILWVAYMFEHNMIHKSAISEFVTRWIIVIFALLPTFLFFRIQFHYPTELAGYLRCHEAVQLVCVGYLVLLATHKSMRLHADFHGGRAMLMGTPRHLIKERKKKSRPRALQQVERIRLETSSLVDLWWVDDAARFVVTTLLAVTILGDIALIDTRWSMTINWLLIVLFCIFIIGVVIWGIHAMWKFQRAVKRIGSMFELILETCREEHLRYVLANINMQKLIKYSPALRKKLCVEPVSRGMYDTWCKAVSIDAIQKLEISVSLNTHLQEMIFTIVKSCNGEELTYLKTLIDGSCSYLNFYKLIYTDMSHKEMREELLRHIQAEAYNVRLAFGVQGVKVLSDIDDTCKASGGMPAGLDKQYPKGTMYPGVFSMYRYLDAGWDPTKPSCNLVFLSARPHVFKDQQEENVYAPMVPLYEDGFIHSFPTLLPGGMNASITAGVAQYCLGTRAWRKVGVAKYETYKKYRDIYPEYDFVFCGDDGQGDLMAGQMMLQEKAGEEVGGPKLLAVLIHEILPESGRPAQVISASEEEEDDVEQDNAWRQIWLSKGLVLHKTYVGAAVKLHSIFPNTFKLEVVLAITTKAVEEFISIVASAVGWTEADWKEAMAYLQHDLSEAEKLCTQGGLGRLPQIPPLKELVNLEDEASDEESSGDFDGVPLLAE